ncbi:MAG: hypothetical protein R3C03_23705 [Pirellulaceae bacterium]
MLSNRRLDSIFVIVVLMFNIPAAIANGVQQDDRPNESDWSFEIVRETTSKKQEIVLNIAVDGQDGEESQFRNVIYEKEIDPKKLNNAVTAFTFFENPKAWAHLADIEDFQIVQMDAINKQFREKVKKIVKSQLDKRRVLPGNELPRWKLDEHQIAEVARELEPLEIQTELLALDVLLPHQQQLILKEHFSTTGWNSLDSVYGRVVLGLDNEQAKRLAEEVEKEKREREKVDRELSLRKKTISNALWEAVLLELSESQRDRLKRFKSDFSARLKMRTNIPSRERYSVNGVIIDVYSLKEQEEGLVVAEPCQLSCSIEGAENAFRNVSLFDHSLAGIGKDLLPLVANHRYLLGIELSAEKTDKIDELREEFLELVSEFAKEDLEKKINDGLRISPTTISDQALGFAVGLQIKKTFNRLAGECYAVLDDSQQKLLLENRLGFELYRKGILVFLSEAFCNEIGLDGDQRTKIRSIIERSEDEFALITSTADRKIAELQQGLENEILNGLSRDQRKILNDIR